MQSMFSHVSRSTDRTIPVRGLGAGGARAVGRRRGQRAGLTSRLARNWMLLVAVVVIAVSGFTVYRLHGRFASEDVTSTPTGIMDNAESFNPKRVLIEVFGPPGATATITYLDVDARPQRADDAPLPWSYDATTTKPAIAVNVSAKGDSDSIGCRITIDDDVKDERTVNTVHAFTYCLDKSG